MEIFKTGTLRGLYRFAASALFVVAATEGCRVISGLSDLEMTQGAPICAPGSVRDCYTGPEGTQGLGVCVGGIETCEPDGSAWGSCSGDIMPDPSPENCAGGVDSNCDGQSMCTGAMLWGYLARSTEAFVAHTVAVDSVNDIVVAGALRGTASFRDQDIGNVGTENDGFVAKLDPEGALKWVKTYGAPGEDAVLSAAIGADDSIVIAGRFTNSISFDSQLVLIGAGGGDMFVAKLDKDGILLWARSFGDASSQSASSVTLDADGNVLVTGWFSGSIDFGMGPHGPSGAVDGVVAKLGPSGVPLWSASISGPGVDEGLGVTVDSAGDVVVGGRVSGDVVFNNMPVLGNSAGGAFVGKLSGASGNPLWGKVFGAPSAAHAQLVLDVARAGSAGEVVVAGHFEDAIQFPPNDVIIEGLGLNLFIAKLDQDGNAVWSKGFGGNGLEVAHEVDVDSFGNITVVGSFEAVLDFGPPTQPLTSLGGPDGVVVKLNPDGDVLWAQGARGPGTDGAYGVAVDAIGTTYITGVAGPLLVIGEKSLDVSSNVNIFFAKLTP
jgi:hypothetical protein